MQVSPLSEQMQGADAKRYAGEILEFVRAEMAGQDQGR
jgi:hypothetical protein